MSNLLSAGHGQYIYVFMAFLLCEYIFQDIELNAAHHLHFLVDTLLTPKTMLFIKFPEVWVSMTAITFCLCVLWKACITWHFWATNWKLTFSWKITPQGAILPLNIRQILYSCRIRPTLNAKQRWMCIKGETYRTFLSYWYILANLLCCTMKPLGMWNRLGTPGRLPCGVSLKFHLLHRIQRDHQHANTNKYVNE